MAEQMDYKVGDTLSLKRNTPVDDTAVVGDYTLVITDIVDGWPGYQQYNYQTDKGKLVVTENFLAVMNYAYAVKGVDLRPYEVWCKGHTNGNPISVKHFANRILSNEIADLKNGSEIKIKNIVFTLEVVGALILCAVGFTIYWITSVKSRENLFGIYRAMGISSSETNRMIWIEEFVLTFTSIFIGVFSGVLSIYLFTPLFAALYLPEKHAVKLDISFNYSDVLIILAIILIILVVCNIILGNAIRKLKITDAVKLGED
jgi:putative ABC transport system permease protein